MLAGHAVNNPTVKVNFPLDNSTASLLSRFNAASDTLQNLNGPGKGCPIVSTTFQAQVAAIRAGKPLPQPVVPPSSPSPTSTSSSPARSPSSSPVPAAAPSPAPSTSGQPTPAQIEAVAPKLGFTSGKNPTGKPIFLFVKSCNQGLTVFTAQAPVTVMVPSTGRMESRSRYPVPALQIRRRSTRYVIVSVLCCIRGRQRCSFAVSISSRTLLRATRCTTQV